jgi:catechol 2,3-dioxygenase-like lactoylglutathione lyase family enzyme
MSGLDRRQVLMSGVALGSTAIVGTASGAAATANNPPVAGAVHKGFPLYPPEESNPLDAKIVAFTTVSPDVDASIRFYRDVMGFQLLDEGKLQAPVTTAPGAGKPGRRYAHLGVPTGTRGATVRVLEAPPGAKPIRPRPGANTWDPGLLVMEGGTRDPAESYHKLASAGTPVISPPRYYPFRGAGRPLDPMSYAPFGPGGEQMFITANISNERDWKEPGLHTAPANAAIVSLDQRPVEEFYFKALGLRRTTLLACQQRNCNELIGAPPDANFLWGVLGAGVSIEVWEFRVPEGKVYPTSLDATGLAMLTIRVKDLAECRRMWRAAGIEPVGEGALPLPGNATPKGFTLRGAVGELVEVIEA